MQNISLYIYGSQSFYGIISDLNIFKKVYLGKNLVFEADSIAIVFVNSFSSHHLSSFYKLKLPIIFILNNKEKKKINLNNFSLSLKTPIEVQNFIEISKILISKFNYLRASQVFINNYVLNSNDRFLQKEKKKIKLTEIEVKLILFIKNFNGTTKEQILENVWKKKSNLDSHAFETCLHRLRKKIKVNYDDDMFINFKNDKYYLL